MNILQSQKLDSLLKKRLEKIEALNHFDSYFETFSYKILHQAVFQINSKLENNNIEGLKIFYENPYENKRSRYFVMIQLMTLNSRRNNFFLDNTASNPSLLFEGDEFTARVKSTIQFESKINKSFEHEIIKLNDEDYVTGIVLDFLDKIYSL